MAVYQSEFQGATIDARLAAVATMQTAISNLETAVAAKYSKPANGIPETDLDASVQAALALARTAVQSLSDYYTKAQVDDITAAIAASVDSTSGVVVTALPSAGAGTLGKIYYVGPDANGFYDRYVTSYDGSTYSWLALGNTEVDMTQYATVEQFNQLDQEVNGDSFNQSLDVTAGTTISVVLNKTLAANTSFDVTITGANIGTQVAICADNVANELGRVTVNGGTIRLTTSSALNKIIIYRYGTYVTGSGTINISLLFAKGMIETLDEIGEDVAALDETVNGSEDTLALSESSGKYYLKQTVGSTIASEASILANADGYYKAVDLSQDEGKTLVFRITGNAPSSSRGIMLTSNSVVINAYNEADILNQDIVLVIPANAILYESHAANTTIAVRVVTSGLVDLREEVAEISVRTQECYVSASGNDNNNGTNAFPFKTVRHAVELGYRNICVMAGAYDEYMNFQHIVGLNIYAYNLDSYNDEPRNRPVFSNGKVFDSFQTSGNNKYFALATANAPKSYKDVFIDKTIEPVINYQGFENTFNAGLWAKCANMADDFMFKPVLSSAGLSEDNTFFYDGTNVYFHTSATINGVVVVGDNDSAQFINCNSLKLSGLDFGYGYTNGVDILGCDNVVVDNCAAHHALRRNNWDYTRTDIKFHNCTAYKARRDGFNSSWYGVAILNNCKALYNGDDGESSHEYCEVVVVGGEYAYNGKAGHAPVNGVKFSCNGTYSHDNVLAGLYYMSASGFDYPLPLITNSAFLGNGVNDIQTDHDITLLNCVYDTIQSSEGATVTDLNL